MTKIITVDNNIKYGDLHKGDIIKEKYWSPSSDKLQNKEYVVTEIIESKSGKSVNVMVKTVGGAHNNPFYRTPSAVRKTTMVIDDWQLKNRFK